MASIPSEISSKNASPAPITAGIFIFLARMAVWEFEEPYDVTNASTFSLSRETVSLGTRLSAQIITFSSDAFSSFPDCVRFWMIRFEISLTSAALACMYVSSMAAKISAKLSEVTATAYSAFTICVFMIFSTDSL